MSTGNSLGEGIGSCAKCMSEMGQSTLVVPLAHAMAKWTIRRGSGKPTDMLVAIGDII